MRDVFKRLVPWSPFAVGLLGAAWQVHRIPHAPTDLAQGLIALEAVLCAALIPGLAMHALRAAPRATAALRARPSPGVLILLLALGAFLLRAFLPPIFLHVEFVGLKYWSMAVDPTLLYAQDPSFGRGGLLTQSILAALFGGSLRAFFVGNALLSGATVALGGFLVMRWSRSPRAAPIATAALLALHPLLVRVGASEDVHVVAGFWALLAILFLEVYARNRRDGDLLAAIAAGTLAACSRQFLLPMPLLMGLLWLERVPGPRLGRRPLAWAALGLMVGTALLKWSILLPGLISAGSGAQHGTGSTPGALLACYRILSATSLDEPHPLLDQFLTSVPLLLLVLWGLIRAGPGRLPRTLGLAWVYLLVLSLPLGYWGIGVRYLFRSPLILVSLLAAGAGLGELLDRLGPHRHRIAAISTAALLVLTAALAVPRIAREARADPFTRQILWLEAVLPTLPDDAVILTASPEDLDTPNLYLKLPARLLNPDRGERKLLPLARWPDLPGVRADTAVYVLDGVACHAVSVFELDDSWRKPDILIQNVDAEGLWRITHAEHPGQARIRDLRAPCRRPDLPLPRRSDPGLDIPATGLRTGNFFYDEAPFRIGLRRVR